ncbi:hypothetical protein [Autumnicola musiva]|uniref:Uncharacterized protein n=1 Tax=Autumnicola musiva TaxID=3075589 RepID=A0ABU3D0P3_9FLAO|nr:hypothetical protein [Zunongwangia sp. F117]MDT0675102.1 hypothetical protein [Zunongwangia sp. F117]
MQKNWEKQSINEEVFPPEPGSGSFERKREAELSTTLKGDTSS